MKYDIVEFFSKNNPKGKILEFKDHKYKIFEFNKIKTGYWCKAKIMKKMVLLTPTFDYYSGVDRVAEERAKYFSENNDVTVITMGGNIKND